MQKLTSFFLFASGADITLLEKCPTDKSKYVGIGATIFFTGLFAALAAAYALFTVFDSLVAAAILGLIWGFMIFNLDRYIVSSMRKDTKFIREFSMATPRLLLAIGISLIIAKPLELKIFEKEINAELVIMEQKKLATQEAEVKQRFEPAINSIKQDISNLKSEINSKAAHRDDLAILAQEEADGTGGSKRRNLGPIYKLKKVDVDQAEKELREITETNIAKIKLAESELSTKDSVLSAELFYMERNKLDGPAARLEALSQLTQQSSAIWWANIFMVMLFIIIETTPIMVKLISRSGPYDALLHLEEHGFICEEVEGIAVASTETKRRTENLGNTEHSYVTRKLDAELL